MNVMLSKTFFPQHPKAGEPTEFREKVLTGTKRHTCRCNYDYWKTRIETLKKRQGILSLRQWSGKPYQKGSTQEPILDIAASLIDVQQLVMHRGEAYVTDEVLVETKPGVWEKGTTYDYSATVDGQPVEVSQLAENDGLELEDFKAWYNPVFDEAGEDTLTFAVIHFTTFRY